MSEFKKLPFKNGDPCYFNNHPAFFVAQINEKESMVSIISAEHYDEDGYQTPVEITIPAYNSRITKEPIDVAAWVEEMEAKSLRRVREVERASMERIRTAEREAQKQRQELAKKAQAYEGLSDVIKYIEGEFKWVVVEEYRFRLVELDKAFSNSERKELALLSFRTDSWNKKARFECYLGRYSDDSGSRDRAWLFETKEDAIKFIISQIEGRQENMIMESDIELCGGPSVFSERVRGFLKEKQRLADVELEKKIEAARRELKRLEEKCTMKKQKTTQS